MEIALLLLIPLPAIILNYSIYSSLLEWKTAIPAMALVSGPLFPVFAILLIVWETYNIPLPVAWLIFVSVLIFLYWPGVNPANKFASQIEPLRTSEKQQLADIPIQEWQDKIPPGSIVLADSSTPVEKIWFELDSCGYWSRLQGAGIVFNRNLAIIYAKRRIILEGMVWGRENTCRHFKKITILPDYLIFRSNTKKWCLRKI